MAGFSKAAIGRRMKSNAHPGFNKVSSNIAEENNVSQERADAILAASTRNASAGAKRRNPNLRRV